MSTRERRNRKDTQGKTPEQIRHGQHAHELAYDEAIKDQDTLGIKPGSMGAAWCTLLDEMWPYPPLEDSRNER